MSVEPDLAQGEIPRVGPAHAARGDTGSNAPVLRRKKGDWIAVGAISALAAVAFGGAMLTANINDAELTVVNAPGDDAHVVVPSQAPAALTEAFSLPTAGYPGLNRPLVARGLVITNDEHTVTATNEDGSTAWTYARSDVPICSIGSAWDKVVVTFETGVGCGDVVAISADTGEYAGTRSALSSDYVVPIRSNDRVGTVSNERVELWRSDLVRTVEYGDVEAKQESGFQPHEDCTINSALTRSELLVVSESCPDQPETSYLRFMKTTPEDSRKPEVLKDVAISTSGARVVAVGTEGAAVYVPSSPPLIISFNQQGQETSRTEVPASPTVTQASSPFAPATGDLPAHMTWWDGKRLYLFNPETLAVERSFDRALGVGTAISDRLAFPTRDGIAVANWSTGEIERTIPVDRGGYSGPVAVSRAGNNLVELRGNEVVALDMRTG